MPNGLPELTVDCHTVLIIPIFDLAEEIDVAWFPCVEEQLGERDCERCIPIKLPVQMRCATVCEYLAAQTSSRCYVELHITVFIGTKPLC